jgi:hypothetical protein
MILPSAVSSFSPSPVQRIENFLEIQTPPVWAGKLLDEVMVVFIISSIRSIDTIRLLPHHFWDVTYGLLTITVLKYGTSASF